MLQGILTQCCFPQLSLVSSTAASLLKIDFLGALPVEISFKILTALDTVSLSRAAQVSRKWRVLADDDQVWHRMCEQHVDRKCKACGWGLPVLEKAALRNWKREQQLRASAHGLNQWSPKLMATAPNVVTDMGGSGTDDIEHLDGTNKRRLPGTPGPPNQPKRLCMEGVNGSANGEPAPELVMQTRRWKEVYSIRYKVSRNWKHMKCTTSIFEGHTNGVICLQLGESLLATGSYDNTIKLWDIETGKCIRTFVGHTAGVRALQFDNHKIISGSIDHTIKVWDIKTGKCITTLRDHSDKVVGLHFDGNILASASADHTIKIYDLLSKKLRTIDGHTDWVNGVRLDLPSRTIFSASDDATVRVWDLDTGELIQVLKHVAHVQMVVFMPEDYELDESDEQEIDLSDDGVSSSRSSSPSPYAATHGAPDNADFLAHWPASDAFSSWPAERTRPPRYVLTASLDSVMRLWCVESGRCLKKYFGHVEGIWAAAADRIRVVSGSQDHSTKVWDARTGKCERTIVGHSGPVTCIGLSDSRLVTGSEDNTIRILNFDIES